MTGSEVARMAGNRTSAYRDYMARLDEIALERFDQVKGEFAQARDDRSGQPREVPADQEAGHERGSAHRDYLDQRENAALDRYEQIRNEFNDTQQGGDPQRDRQAERGSQMVAKDAPHQANRPPDELARPVDREVFNDIWREEMQSAARQEQQPQREQENGL
jgi:hypothetical protein